MQNDKTSPLVTDVPRINLGVPRYDQSTFSGRSKHFFETANPLNVFTSNQKLAEAAEIIQRYKLTGQAPSGLTVDQLWRYKVLYDSAYHPDTGEKMFLLGRMSAQVPMNMTIIGCMLTFYKSPGAVMFWQWINQSFNACVNYTNRSGDRQVSTKELAIPYVAATTAATVTALGLNVVAKSLPPIIGRFVPFTAVAAANAINIPLMRQQELKVGVTITDENDNKLGESKKAGMLGISQVVFSRIVMAMPAMVVPPIIMNSLEKKGILKRYPSLNAPLQITLAGICLVFATPLCCAIFPQKSSIPISSLEDEVRESLLRTHPDIKTVYYNKGL